MLHILSDRLFVPAHGIHIIAAVPEVSVPLLVLQIRMPVEDHQAALPFQVPHDFRYTVFRRDCYIQMDVIPQCRCFNDLNAFPTAQRSDNLPYICRYLLINRLSSVLRREDDVVFTIPFCMC